jgi:phage baseplate assembly protein gpV
MLLSCTVLVMAILFISGCSQDTTAEPPSTDENRPPVISEILADIQVNVKATTEIVCIATDPEGGTITYTWSADRGTINGSGSKITWTAPDTAGVCAVKVIVSDPEGLKAEQTLSILAKIPEVAEKPNQAPVIKDLIIHVKGKLPQSLTPDMEIPRVKRYTTAEFECIASDPDGGTLKYIWGATIGKLEGTGPKVQYIATTAETRVVISVTVVDDKNARANASMTIAVPCCSN